MKRREFITLLGGAVADGMTEKISGRSGGGVAARGGC